MTDPVPHASFATRIQQGPPLLLDGGLGTLLMARGLPAGAPPERWVLERPDALVEAHCAYVQAGAEAIHCCTFGANRVRLAPFGLVEDLETLNRQAVRLARRAGAPFVIGDLGPTGEYLPPVGSGEPTAWARAFSEQAALLVDEGVDAFHVETMSHLREARIALEAVRAAAPHLPVMVSMTFDRKRRGFFTIMGDRPVPSLQALVEGGATVVGANCSLTSPHMLDLAREVLAGVAAPTVFQPNAGQPRPTAEGVRYDQDPEDFAADMARLASLGAAVVGGCCGSDPRFVRALRVRLSSPSASGPESA